MKEGTKDKIRQINCLHYLKASRKAGGYTYKLNGAELNLCRACEKKLRKGILEQIDAEDYLG
jgi:hypothetical protein